MLDLLGVEHVYIDSDADVGKIRPAIDKAYATSRPVALIVGRSPI